MAQKTDNSNKNVIVNTINVRPIRRGSLDIQEWRNALKAAEGYVKNRQRLYNLYHDIMLDGHLKSIIDKRVRAITNTTLRYIDQDGQEVEELKNVMQTGAFERILQEIVLSKLWGYSLLEIDWNDPDHPEAYLIDRRHVKPENGQVVAEPSMQEGIGYNDEPYINFIVRAGQTDSLGLLLQAAQYVIYKRGGISDWAEYAQIFGIPTRIAKYTDPANKEILEQAFENMGPAGYMVVPDETELETVTTQGQDGSNLYKEFRKAMNEELSVLILGQSMTTTEASSSGYAQSQTHSDVEEEIHKDDRAFVLRVLNTEVKRVLATFGYNIENGRFAFADEDSIPITDRIKIDMQIAQRTPISDDYFYEKYGIPKPENYEQMRNEMDAQQAAQQQQFVAQDTGNENNENNASLWTRMLRFFQPNTLEQNSNTLQTQLDNLYNISLDDDDDVPEYFSEEIFRNTMRKLHNGDINPNDLDPELLNAIRDAIQEGINFVDDEGLRAALSENVWTFSGFKTRAELKEASQLLTDSDDNIKDFSKFLKDVEKLHTRYNKHYLHAEYKNAVGQSQMAQKWQDYEKSADRFYLEYSTAGDSDVRPEHARLDGITLPVDSEFWSKYYPPNGWGCRCRARQVLKSQATKSNAGNAVQEGDKATAGKDSIFRFNAGKEKKVFPDTHPYFNVGSRTQNRIKKSIKNIRDNQ